MSRYSDWLRPGRPRGRSSSPGRVQNTHFSISSRPTTKSTLSSIYWVPGAHSSGIKRQRLEADHKPPTWAKVNKTRTSTSTPPIRLHEVVLSFLSTSKTLPFIRYTQTNIQCSKGSTQASVCLCVQQLNNSSSCSVTDMCQGTEDIRFESRGRYFCPPCGFLLWFPVTSSEWRSAQGNGPQQPLPNLLLLRFTLILQPKVCRNGIVCSSEAKQGKYRQTQNCESERMKRRFK
jgi:hypothetical protein